MPEISFMTKYMKIKKTLTNIIIVDIITLMFTSPSIAKFMKIIGIGS